MGKAPWSRGSSLKIIREILEKKSKLERRECTFRGHAFVGSKAQLWSLEDVDSFAGVVEVLEVTGRHFGQGLAERTLEPPAAVSELHQGAHVGLAPAASDRTLRTKICNNQCHLVTIFLI